MTRACTHDYCLNKAWGRFKRCRKHVLYFRAHKQPILYFRERYAAMPLAKRYGNTPRGKAAGKKWEAANKVRRNKQRRNRLAGNTVFLAKHRAYVHHRRAQLRGTDGRWTPADFDRLCGIYNNRCLCCGKKRKLTPDHIVPLIKGGTNSLANIQPLCKSCNSSKQDLHATDYRNAPHANCGRAQ